MSKRRTDDEVTRSLKDTDRGKAKVVTVSDFCRKAGVAQTIDHRWRSGMTRPNSIPIADVANYGVGRAHRRGRTTPEVPESVVH